jgi:hypothetical protein
MLSSGELARYGYEFRNWLPPPCRSPEAQQRAHPAASVSRPGVLQWLLSAGWPARTVQATPPRTGVSRLDGDHLRERLAGTPGRVRTRRPAAEKVPHRRPAESPRLCTGRAAAVGRDSVPAWRMASAAP